MKKSRKRKLKIKQKRALKDYKLCASNLLGATLQVKNSTRVNKRLKHITLIPLDYATNLTYVSESNFMRISGSRYKRNSCIRLVINYMYKGKKLYTSYKTKAYVNKNFRISNCVLIEKM